jgi:hypothetical protein
MVENQIQNQQGGALVHYDYGDLAGQGYEGTSKADFQIPFLNIVQVQSPVVTQGKPEYNPAAKAGMLFNSATMQIYDGAAGVTLIPCATQRVFCEFAERGKGSGFQGVHAPEDPIVTAAVAASKLFGKYNTPSGNNLVETFYMFGLLVNEAEILGPVILAFSSTKIKVYKSLMTVLRACTVNKKTPPLFANRVKVGTASETNPKGTFLNYTLAPANGTVQSSLVDPSTEVGKAILSAGKEFQVQVGSGKIRADHAQNGGDPAPTEEVPF